MALNFLSDLNFVPRIVREETFTPNPQLDQANVLQAMQSQPAMQAPMQAEAPRQRRSLLDTIGRISDVLARVGGAEALYQPTLDARQDRELAMQNQTRQVDLDALRKQLLEQQVASGGMEVQQGERARLAQALGGVAGNPETAALWPQIAEQAGIDPQRSAAIGQMLQANPNAGAILARSLGWQPATTERQGTQAKELQIYNLLQQKNPEAAQQYLESLTSQQAEPMSAYQQAQVDLGRDRLALNQRLARDRRINMPARQRLAESKQTEKDTNPQAAAEIVRGNLSELRSIYDALNSQGALVSPSQSAASNLVARARSSGVGQAVEGALGTQAQTLRDRVNSIRPALMQSIAKATGMTGKQLDSNADIKLFMQTVTDPSSSYEANIAALNGLERFIQANSKQAGTLRRTVTPRQSDTPASRPSVSNW